MKTFFTTLLLHFVFTLFLFSQVPVNQVEGFLEVYHSEDTSSLYIGKNAGQAVSGSFRRSNTFVGKSSGAKTTSIANSFFGHYAGSSSTTGGDNSFIGRYAGRDNTEGRDNSFVGSSAGLFNTTGSNNTFVGRNAGTAITTQDEIIVVGAYAGPLTMGANENGRLYIDVDQTNDPLIYGDFEDDLLRINGTLQLGAQNYFGGSDDGLITSPPGSSSDIFITSNDNVTIEIGEVLSTDANFDILNGVTNVRVFRVDKNGNITNSGTINGSSDINRKELIKSIDTKAILKKVAKMQISKWQYKGASERHIGPMAQDFYEAFGLGQGETTISTVDADGIAFAAIQALAHENEKLKLENKSLQESNADIITRLIKLEKIVADK